ncbi:MAG: PEP-CTERM sorting domain-containing protein [Planctomycetota bacterium]|nr:MAG: PEP-CTERM sorting domain-containing protein [Planctomycetota bacterium]
MMQRAIVCGFLLLVCGADSGWAAPPLSVQFKNDSGLANSDVYIGFVGPGALDATNAATNAPLSVSQFGDENWYTLDTLPQGIELNSFSGRIYVGYGSPWSFTHSGYEPSPVSPSDPNRLLRYDKMELTYHGNPADVADTTSIDYFSIPLELNVYQGGLAGTKVSSLTASPTQTTLDAVRGIPSPADAAVVTDGGGQFVRVIGPSAYPPSPGLPASPYDNFDAYLTYVRDSYAPSHGGTVATIKGRFAGVGPAPVTPETMGQDYAFTATIDADKNITLTGAGTITGAHTLLFKYEDLTNPSGIYGANPSFYLDGSPTPINPQNDVFGWLIGDLMAGFNIGAIGSTVLEGGVEVGTLDSQDWFALTELFAALQPNDPFYNPWAATMSEISEAYNFAYSDRFDHVVAPLDPARVDTLEVVFLAQVPEPSTYVMLATGAALLLAVRFYPRRRARRS